MLIGQVEVLMLGEARALVQGKVTVQVQGVVVVVLLLLGQVLALVPEPVLGEVLLVLVLAGPQLKSPPPHDVAHHPRSQLPAGVCHVLPTHPAGSSAQASTGTPCHPLLQSHTCTPAGLQCCSSSDMQSNICIHRLACLQAHLQSISVAACSLPWLHTELCHPEIT
jgi:hypothetical protein